MAKQMHCWRCRTDIPMLDEIEWERMSPLLSSTQDPDARQKALDLYYAITGVRETNHLAIWHHRTSLYGPPCAKCNNPYRTPEASFCAACGFKS